MDCLRSFFEDWEPVVQGVASIATVLSLLLGAVAVLFTAIQIRRNTRQLQVQSVYAIQKDARQMAHDLIENADVARELLGLTGSSEERVRATLGQIFNFYSSIAHQHRLGLLDDRLWQPFELETRRLMKLEQAREHWTAVGRQSGFDPAFVALVDGLIPAEQTGRKGVPEEDARSEE